MAEGGVSDNKVMNLYKAKKAVVAVALGALMTFGASAQSVQSLRHSRVHKNLLANQATVKQQMKFDYSSEVAPEEGDIYEIAWGSERVNPYQGMSVPNSQKIDVRGFVSPHNGSITSPYGYRKRFGRMHRGVDIGIHMGDTIRCAFDGKIRLTRYEGKGYGYYVVVRHDNGLETVYGHLSRFLVKPNQMVRAGQPIALGGSTGRSTGPHLHFETRFMGYAINPAAIIDFSNHTVHTNIFTFNKSTYERARNFAPKTRAQLSENTTLASASGDDNSATETIKNSSKKKDRNAKGDADESKSKRKGKKSDKETSQKASTKSVTIEKGESLEKIARKHNTTVEKLCKLNNIDSKTIIRVGDKIKVG